MRSCRSLFTTLATVLAVAALLLVPRTRAADAPTPPASLPNTVSPPIPASPTNSLPVPAKDDRAADPAETPPPPPPTAISPSPLPPVSPSSPPTTNRSSSLPARENRTASSPAPRIDFSTFKILTERNIFDPNRSSRGSRYSTPSSDTPPPARPPAPTIVETFTLVGTLAYGDNQMAFIDGPSSQYKKALRLNDTIAGLKLKSVAANAAAFDHDGKEISLRIGHQLRREDRREWQVNTQPTTYASAPLAPGGITNPSTASTTNSISADTTSVSASGTAPVVAKPDPAPTGAEAEALRRLLEKRRKEEEK